MMYTMALNNGYSRQLVDTILKTVRSKNVKNLLYSPGRSTETDKFKKINFFPYIPHKLIKSLKKSSIRLAFYNPFN